ncbi:hypothetical protein C8T65DRAFT_150581 [Cerioporus squamosus]|nr:hypothetical protein C8T65DRAFT_150581 [Cerioporus squamosus]
MIDSHRPNHLLMCGDSEMDGDTEGVPVIDRAPSRASHRPNRPPLKRSNASFNAFPDLPPIRDSPTPPLDTSSSTDGGSSSSSSSDESEDDFKIDLTPLCPPSPPSPTSLCGECSSDPLFPPLDQEDWERFHDGFVPPAFPEPYSPSWPPTPTPQLEVLRAPRQCEHYGWSNNALYEMKAGLWFRRQWAWWHYEEHCRYLVSLPTNASDDGIAATVFFPPPPLLPPSRRVPWMSANGLPLPRSERVRAQPQPAADPAWKASRDFFKPIYPRFGDIADLRDSSYEETDRRYYAVPAFKLRQFVFVSEMDALRGQPRKAASLAPPSPLARCWTPDSPASVYSQDTAVCASPIATATPHVPLFGDSDSSQGARPLMTEWRFRWQLIHHLFPTPPPPPVHAHPFLARWFPPAPSPPPRPGTPLPDEQPSTLNPQTVSEADVLLHEDEGAAADSASIVSVAPAPLSGDTSFTEISIHLPAPLPVSYLDDIPARPPTPSIEAAPTVQDPSPEAELVIRLPTPSYARSGVQVVAPLATPNSNRPKPSTLAQELERASANQDSSVRFSIRPPPPCPESPRFSFIAYDSSEDPFADEHAVDGY